MVAGSYEDSGYKLRTNFGVADLIQNRKLGVTREAQNGGRKQSSSDACGTTNTLSDSRLLAGMINFAIFLFYICVAEGSKAIEGTLRGNLA